MIANMPEDWNTQVTKLVGV